jgi:hypothetical protein
MRQRIRVAILATVLAAPVALAQDEGASADILGSWTFEASPTYDSCFLHGEATLRPGPSADVFLCELVANDVCPNIWSYRAEQTCTATRKGDRLTISSQIESVDPQTDRYLPDNFVLRIVNDSLMVGELRSAVDAPAEFRRTAGPIT